MEIKIDRAWKKDGYTISRVFLDDVRFGDGRHYCNCLEDTDRGLTQSMSLSKIKEIKIKGRTAIPSGKYEILITYSPKYKRNMPLVNNVPGYEGIRIHAGNTAKDTEGCLLFGLNDKVGMVSNSRYWTTMITGIIDAAIKRGEHVYIRIG